VPPNWLQSAVSLFSAVPSAAMCYGTVLAAPELESTHGSTPCLILDERQLVGGRAGYRLRGMGANMAIRRSVLSELGGFDQALGAGAALRSAEDFDLQFRAHRRQMSTLLDPSWQVVHYGFRSRAEWRGLFWRDGCGVGAFFMKHVRCGDPLAVRELVRFISVEAARSAKNLLLGRGVGRTILLAGVIWGSASSFRFSIDRDTRCYRRP